MDAQNRQDALDAQRQSGAVSQVRLEDPTLATAKAEATAGGDIAADPPAIAKLSVPRFGADWQRVVYEGTSLNTVLTPLGVGHYTFTAAPGQSGNFALAAHRAGSGGPFRNIDKLKAGDIAIVETATQRFTYRFLQSKVVAPDAVGVLASPPEGLTANTNADAFLTLTTCTPIHVNTHRYVVWFELVASADI